MGAVAAGRLPGGSTLRSSCFVDRLASHFTTGKDAEIRLMVGALAIGADGSDVVAGFRLVSCGKGNVVNAVFGTPVLQGVLIFEPFHDLVRREVDLVEHAVDD